MDYKKLNELAISNNGFVFNPINGDSFTLNPTGKFIMENLREQKNKDEIIELIVQKYDVKKDEAELDFDNFMNQLSMYKLV